MAPATEADVNGRSTRDRALFDRIADSYARKDRHVASRAARCQRLVRTLSCVRQGHSKPDVLELGCGAGFSPLYLRGTIGKYHGVDYSAELIAVAEAENAGELVTFECADIHDLSPQPDFDVVFMVGVLHHLPDPASVLRHVTGFVRPGGWVVANEPHDTSPVIAAMRWVRARADSAYSDEQRPFRLPELKGLFLEAGLTDITLRPQGVVSTPFAEVALNPPWLWHPVSLAACVLDRALEAVLGPCLVPLSWNTIASGRRPE